MKMLLKQLIESPMNSSRLLVCDPFRELDREELVTEVIGLANADVDGPRNILFGVNAGALDGGGIVGIAESYIADLKRAHRILSELIEPVLHLAFIYDRINGKLVGALEIDGCDDRPYIVGKNFSEKLSRGQCWVREDRDLRSVQPGDLSRSETIEPVKKPVKMGKPPPIAVGFNDEPSCRLLEVAIPDSSDPPFAEDKRQREQSSELKQTIREKIGTVTTRILRLGSGRKQDESDKTEESGTDTQGDDFDETQTVLADANDHYFFEEKALRLNLCARNMGSEEIENVSIKLGFPRVQGFEVVDRLYTSPFDKRSQQSGKNLGYPGVERSDDAAVVRGTINRLVPGSPKQVFNCDLRLAVGPRMKGKKIAILYTLRGPDNQSVGKGRLKIKFAKESA
ncbi:MAG: ATP-binding protein [Woeseiaceae bacterium]